MHTLRLGWNFICSLGHQMSGVMCANEWEVNVKQNHFMFVEAFGTILFPEITTDEIIGTQTGKPETLRFSFLRKRVIM